jgi:hypothetical protein
MKLPLSIAAIVWATSLPLSAAAQAGAPANTTPVTPPRPAQPQPLVTPRITPPLVKPKPPTADPPALQGGKPAAPGGYDDPARRCEALSDIQQRTQCRDRVVRETPVRPPG